MRRPVELRENVIRYIAHGLGRETTDLVAISPFGERSGNTKQEVVLLPNHWVYPFNWHAGDTLRAICSIKQQSFNPKLCQEVLKVGERAVLLPIRVICIEGRVQMQRILRLLVMNNKQVIELIVRKR